MLAEAVKVKKRAQLTKANNMSTETFTFDCPSCSGSIEVSNEACGQSIACPHCSDAIIAQPPPFDDSVREKFAPPSAFIPKASPMIAPAKRWLEGEPLLFDYPPVQITRSRFIVGDITYSVRNITSVTANTLTPNRIPYIFLAFIGLAIAIAGGIAIVLGLGIIALAIWLFRRAKETHCITIVTNGGEIRALVHSDARYIEAALSALNAAIAQH